MDNAAHLAAVRQRIAPAIFGFCWANRGCEFHADDLRQHVAQATGGAAPASADRVLRDLRQRGVINYEVVSRKDSRYRIVSVAVPQREGQGALF